jgi:hypothetical protein
MLLGHAVHLLVFLVAAPEAGLLTEIGWRQSQLDAFGTRQFGLDRVGASHARAAAAAAAAVRTAVDGAAAAAVADAAIVAGCHFLMCCFTNYF